MYTLIVRCRVVAKDGTGRAGRELHPHTSHMTLVESIQDAKAALGQKKYVPYTEYLQWRPKGA